ncbi:EAL and HDOD domain-containing protein [Desulfobotulus sp.]|jgi:EAL and modified HD-GYP domain-containing signal transduction protein|uniref:EAL and HDOD domain-containing protein n=1 Tax=Desulfobotulus sp. TaxID=1940337 RepID=UPI002A35987A|nr:HDOD domain-containing protein [Desulfobotulus sp.]MDY0163147.1 HDOD domain-containing protein [Desulfobotulus sp.]
METFVARQPIFNQKKQIVAFELLFRNGMHNAMPEMDGDKASSQLLANTFLNIGIDTLTEGKKAFINFTENLLLQRIPLMLPAQTTVVEILETVNPTEEILQACQEMAGKGYVLALDDFVYSAPWQGLMQAARIIKIDFRVSSEEKIRECMAFKTQRPLIFLAEKVETYEEFQRALALGFSLFQGYFFCRPEIIQGKEIQGQSLNLLQITAESAKEDMDFDRMEALIHRDVGIAYTLLRYINSAFFKRIREITSIRQALVLLGTDEIRRFIAIIALTKICTHKPEALLKASCIRGKFCERLGASTQKTGLSNELFTLGMFSLLDAILDEPMERILEKLSLSRNITDALLHAKGPLFPYLALAIAYEQGDWDAVPAAVAAIQVPETLIPGLYLEACEWSRNLPVA